MDRADEKKYTLDEYNWHIINNLQEFDDKADTLTELVVKMKQYLPDHPILSKFYDLYDTAFEYYDRHKTFPDIQWFEVNYKKSMKMKWYEDPFSIKVFEDCVKCVDAEIIKRNCAGVLEQITPDVSSLRQLTDLISKYCDNTEGIPALSKNDLIGMYDEYSKEYKGVATGISELDEVIGVLGHKSLSVFGAPSGHGKSTFAISVTYNVAVKQGLCVDYISYEVPREHIWFNLVAIHSRVLGVPLVSSEMKENKLNDAQKALYREVVADLTMKLNESGGYINVVDQTSAAVDSFEGLKSRIEGMASERVDGDKKYDRKADLIIVDNVDNFQILRSKERDEMVKVNNYIVNLDAFCKQYHHGDGCAILLLTQLNRGGFLKLKRMTSSDDEGTGSLVDVTVFQRYNALYEKATCCLVGYSDPAMRMREAMNIYAVKIRNRGVPEEAVQVHAEFKYSLVGDIDDNPAFVDTDTYNNDPELSADNFANEDFSDFG